MSAVPAIIKHWLSTLRPVTSQGIEAWVNDSWQVLATEPAAWRSHDVNLAVTLFRPTREEIAQFVEEFDLEDTSPYDEAVWVWRAFIQGMRPVARLGLTQPHELFTIDMTFDWHGRTTNCSWTAVALTSQLALFSERGDERGRDPFAYPLGVISRATAFSSAALLMASRASEWQEFFSSPDFFDELTADGLPDEEVFRILLAACGHGGRDVVHLTADQLPDFTVPPMRYGFADVVDRLGASRKGRRRRV